MKNTFVIWVFLIVTTSSFAYGFNKLNNEVQLLKNQPQSQYNVSQEQIALLVQNEMARYKQKDSKKALETLKNQYSLASDSSTELRYGKEGARFTFEMYSDIECPYCRQMFFDVKKVVDNSKGVINWEYKHFPLGGHNPMAAIEAQAIECIAQEQGNQSAWVALDQFIKQTQGNGKGVSQGIPEFVRTFGLNGSMLKNCMLSDEAKVAVNEDYGQGANKGVSATPAIILKDNQAKREYLIKGKKTPEQLLQAIQSIM
ncbi:hypothetical protein A3740_09870 [Oleiphilus sp. HI0068]|uniref:DsbA family protein n=2 Tax=Oleiphilus sp. HI0132 TaxID=1822270 RepID=UPI0007C2AD84|nr:thioredoxin domain-containing protein [Oleiphilus sp. HI0132]KZY77639.1 hypothetical protein A3740_09870 [Oleiphilus sp. HI0068]KZY81121.1 hypothetical protein A3741_17815 [Oleiphilus sp. HI0069]KZZ32160.1 hypothetical protein A3755_10380 [Oleiphilus sp. HI0085]KZY83193.1 hypothetical protein A3741_16765 [Oleiphilus sp. HI0069]KZZ75894.1 hypothetical protein A3766_15525 [Oleiphilus sp. HI0132]